ncbi:MAG: hypothetical protein IPM25_17300 [Chloracidobacterium sp.]|nr:hypothetical protein [Chloracidobacterium sp.]
MAVEQSGIANEIDHRSTLMQAIVKVAVHEGRFEKCVADVISVSPTGAGFYLDRECKAGHLLSMLIPAEPHLRSYDHQKELYKVWGLVQHCHPVAGDDPSFHIGIAFIGREAPKSYASDPGTSYRICGMDDNGLWKIKEAGKEFKPRKDTRFYVAVDHYLAVVDGQRASLKGERTRTENISKHGAAVLTGLDVTVGDRVKLISEEYDFSGLAVVCNRRQTPDGRLLLNLQFVESKFPVEKIKQEVPVPEGETVFA